MISIKRHISHVKNSRLSQDLPISINNRVILSFREVFIFTKVRIREYKVLAKIFEVEEQPSGKGAVYNTDATVFIQKHKRLDELQEMYLDKIIYCKPKDCTKVHFVGDSYAIEPSVSLKQEELEKRGQSGSGATKE